MAPGTYGDKVGLSVGSSLEFGDLVLYHHDSEMTEKRWWIFFTPKKTQIEAARIIQINVKQSNYALDGHNQQHKKIGGDELTVPQLDLLLASTLGIWLATTSCVSRDVKSPIMPNRTLNGHN